MKRNGQEKTMPLWAIWLITVIAVVAWCSVNGERSGQATALMAAIQHG